MNVQLVFALRRTTGVFQHAQRCQMTTPSVKLRCFLILAIAALFRALYRVYRETVDLCRAERLRHP
jgi:hypothetical protein